MNEVIEREIETTVAEALAGNITPARVRRWLQTVAALAYSEGRNEALAGLMTAADVAVHFGVSERRARALIQNRHERFGIGMKMGREWRVLQDELESLEPDEKYRGERNV